jgi:hypothetical protein
MYFSQAEHDAFFFISVFRELVSLTYEFNRPFLVVFLTQNLPLLVRGRELKRLLASVV